MVETAAAIPGLLARGNADATVGEIAHLAGFADAGNLTRPHQLSRRPFDDARLGLDLRVIDAQFRGAIPDPRTYPGDMKQGQGLLHLLLVATFVSGCGSTASMDDASTDATVDPPDMATLDGGGCDEPDRDGDGIASVACGGNDCDDDDDDRFPGNTEVCDVDHVDEDCDPSTLGGTDVDGDNVVAAACCNPNENDDLVCGEDCNDLRVDINPSATEACDQTDNNCDGRTDEGYDPSTCWPPCMPGTLQTAPASAVSPPTCVACEPGAYCPGGPAPRQPCVTTDWDHDADAGTVCVSRSSCVAGEFVMSEGDATNNRTCATCGTDTYSTTPNATLCASWVTCPAGQYVDVLPSATNDRRCEPCEANHFSDASNALECDAWRDCAAGTSATMPGPATDRVCTACAPGTFSANPNTALCSAHAAVCGTGQVETTTPSATQNRVCSSIASAVTWTRQFGTTERDVAMDVTVAGTDAIFVVGTTQGELPGQTSAGNTDAFVRRYDASGSILWTHQFGTGGHDRMMGVASDSAGQVIVAGTADAALPGQSSAGNSDAFLRKYDTDGGVLWTQQFGTSEDDSIVTMSIDNDGNIIVAGMTSGAFSPYSRVGDEDIFVAKYDASGSRLWLQQFGVEAPGYLSLGGVVADASGNVTVGGAVSLATLPGQTSLGNGDAFLRMYDTDGNVLWTRQFGTSAFDRLSAIGVNASGEVIVAGSTSGSFPGQTSSGNSDLFLGAYDTDGDVLFLHQFGTSGDESVDELGIREDGWIYLVGQTLSGAWSGHTAAGGFDVFVTRHTATGEFAGARQFGTAQVEYTESIALSGSDLFVAGMTYGTWPGQTALGDQDAYVIRMSAW
jgi:hypothetical protein